MAVGPSAGRVKRVVFPAAIIRSTCTKAIPLPSEFSEILKLPVVPPAEFDAFALAKRACVMLGLRANLIARKCELSLSHNPNNERKENGNQLV